MSEPMEVGKVAEMLQHGICGRKDCSSYDCQRLHTAADTLIALERKLLTTEAILRERERLLAVRERENAALREDREMLDWLAVQCVDVRSFRGTLLLSWQDEEGPQQVRAAIRAARGEK